ncbi:unnamed protein product [Phaeothamnion confervicola]
MKNAAKDCSAETAKVHILTLGDGNFSFSLALARLLLENQPKSRFRLTATCFDSAEEIVRKFRETAGILKALKRFGARVAFSIDATALHPFSLGGVADHIVFNHPHSGEEDIRRHRSLLGHFFHNVKTSGALAAPSGAVHVTLAGDQAVKWGLMAQAERNGFRLAAEWLFRPEVLAGYEDRRHHNARGFRGRKPDSITFTFVDAAVTSAALAPEEVRPLWLVSGGSTMANQCPYGGGAGAAGNAATGAAVAPAAALVASNGKGGGSSSNGPKPPSLLSPSSSQPLTNAVASAAATAAAGEEFLCADCSGRAFRNCNALEQHLRAKHRGPFTDVKPDWMTRLLLYLEPGDGGADGPETTRCDACGFLFRDAAAFEAHLRNLRPEAADGESGGGRSAGGEGGSGRRIVCSGCGKTFGQRRGLLQHQNCCSLYAEMEAAAAAAAAAAAGEPAVKAAGAQDGGGDASAERIDAAPPNSL